jgi:aspartate aminotransferase
MDMIQSQSTSGASSVSQAAALAALRGPADFLPGWVETYRQRRDTALSMLNAIPGIGCRTSGGAFYLYVNCGGLIGRLTPDGKALDTDLDVVLYLLESAGVSLIAGSAYGMSPYFRLSIATGIGVIEDGCRRIAKAVAALR